MMGARVLLLVAALAWSAGHAQGEPFPAKPVKIVIPYPVSGPTDIRGTSRVTRTYKVIAQYAPPAISDTLARMIAQAIRAGTRHPVVFSRKPGGATSRGAMFVARSRADGHTLLLASDATMILNPNYFYGVQYDPARDFVLVAPLATMPFVLLADFSLPIDTVQGLAKWLKLRPGEINYGSSGDGSTGHLAGELFRRATGVDIVHVSYNGGVAALNGMATGQVSLMFAALPLALPYLGSELFTALGITGAKRFEGLPGVPTLAERGLPGLEIEGWYGLFAPARTPAAAIVWLNERIAKVSTSSAARSQLLKLGLEPVRVPLGQFATRINSESEKWAPVLRAARLPFRDPAS